MGGNGSASVLGYVPAEDREYIGLGTYMDEVFGEVKIVEWKGGERNKSPEESNSAPRVYVTFYKDGSGVHEISKYGEDHKKEWSIHSIPHNSKQARKKGEAVDGPHIHFWRDGAPIGVKPLSDDAALSGLFRRIQNFQKSR